MKKFFPALRFVFFLSIGAALFYLALRGTDLKSLGDALKNAHYSYVFLSLVLAMVAFASRAYRWNMLIHPLGYRPKFRNTFYSLMFGYLANLALPRLGEVSRAVALNKSEKVPLDAALGTVIAERAIDVLMLFLCVILALVVQFDNIESFLQQYIILPISNKISITIQSDFFIPVIIAGIFSLVVFFLILRKQKFYIALKKKLIDFLKGIFQGLITVIKLKSHTAFIFHTILIWFIYWLVSFICFYSIDATSALDIKAGIFILVVGGIGMTIPVPGGLGSYILLVKYGLLMLNIPDIDAKSYAVIVYTSQTLLVILTGTLSYFPIFNKKPSHASA